MTFIKKHGIAAFILLATFCLLCYFAYYNSYSEGGGDNCWHFFFSRGSFKNPKLFLDHWAKPLFTLLSSPFSQFGIYGTKIFNIIVGVSTAFVAYKFAIAMKFKYSWAVIIIVLYLPTNFFILQSAMTEPLMALVLVTSFYLFFQEKYAYAAIIMSFSLFSRSEGMFLTMYVAMYLLLIKKWKYIPYLGTGLLIYSFVGLFTGRSFLWYFTENPYRTQSQYGHGDWLRFFENYDYVWGLPQTIALCLGLICIVTISIVKIKKIKLNDLIPEHKFLLLVVAPAVIFFSFHVIVWRYGWCSSYGLERVLNCISPLTGLIIIFALNYLILERVPKLVALPLVFIFLFFSVKATFKHITYPLTPYGAYCSIPEATKWFNTFCDPKSRIGYSHPALMLYLDRDPFDNYMNVDLSSINPDQISDKSVPMYLFWDSQFSGSETNVNLETLQNSKSLKLVLHPEESYGFNLYVFEVIR